MSLKTKRVINPVLTKLSQGYSNGEYVGYNLFPLVHVDKEGGQIPQFGKDHFKLWNTKRAPKGDSNRGHVEDPTMIDVVLTEHDFEVAIDYREEQESMFNEERRKAKAAQDVLELGVEHAQATLAQDLSNYGASQKVTLSGDSQWSNHVEDANISQPIKNVATGRNAVRSQVGKYPNVAIIGSSALETLQDHPVILDRIKYTKTGVVTIEDLKTLFKIPHIFEGSAVYVDDDGNNVDLWADVFVMAYAPQRKSSEADLDEPCYGRTLKKKNYPQTDTYSEKGGKVSVVRNTDIYKVALTGAIAGYIITDIKA